MKILALTGRSICLERQGSSPYFAKNACDILLDDAFMGRESRNVFSVFGLTPGREYTLKAGEETVIFRTKQESFCLNVKDFRAIGDGVHDDTAAFTAAIACCPPGGTVYVPPGKYSLKPLFLKSEMTLYLEKNAVLLGNPDRQAYPVLPGLAVDGEGEMNLGTWQGEEANCFASLLTAVNCHDVSVIGQGQIDCGGRDGDWYRDHRTMRIAWRPRGVFFNRCSNVLLQGLTVGNTPSWNIHPYFCENVRILDMKLYNDENMPTTDGIDPDTCENVQMIGVDISVGDDCIALKSGTLEQAKKYRKPCKDITVRNCRMRSGHGGVVLGSELSGGIENVTVERCLFVGTDRGLRIKTRRGRGRYGLTGNITFRDIRMEGVKAPFVVNMYYNMGDNNGHSEYVWTTEKLPVDERTPQIGAFRFENMVCTRVGYCAGAFYGLPEAPIEAITMENVHFSYDQSCEPGYPDMREKNQEERNAGLIFQFTDTVKLENVTFDGCAGETARYEGVPHHP